MNGGFRFAEKLRKTSPHYSQFPYGLSKHAHQQPIGFEKQLRKSPGKAKLAYSVCNRVCVSILQLLLTQVFTVQQCFTYSKPYSRLSQLGTENLSKIFWVTRDVAW